MKTPLVLCLFVAFGVSHASKIETIDTQPEPCAVRAWVHAEDLSPDHISRGELRIKVPRAECVHQIESVALRLQLDEFGEFKFLKKGAVLPAVNQSAGGRVLYDNQALYEPFKWRGNFHQPKDRSYFRARGPSKGTIHKSGSMEVASTVASLCVREQSEVFASAIHLYGDSLVIYLAENTSVPPATESYLDGVLSQLAEISSYVSGKEIELATTILRHTFPKFFSSLTKWDKTWKACVENIRTHIARSETSLETFDTIEDLMNVIHVIATDYSRTKSGHSLSLLYKTIAHAERPYTPSDYIFGDDMDLDLDENNTLKDGFSLTASFTELLASRFTSLLRLAISSTYASFFSKKTVIHCCPSIVKAVHVGAHALLQQLGDYDGFVVAEHGSRMTVTGRLHAELNIFATCSRRSCANGNSRHIGQSACPS
ncbi:hypothetical protein B0H13DRAFT_2674949 [Mycena leptocephala]|nr:hypothetical protein B0H13DRAFT_2674949 [Mycena leptocephala]